MAKSLKGQSLKKPTCLITCSPNEAGVHSKSDSNDQSITRNCCGLISPTDHLSGSKSTNQNIKTMIVRVGESVPSMQRADGRETEVLCWLLPGDSLRGLNICQAGPQ